MRPFASYCSVQLYSVNASICILLINIIYNIKKPIALRAMGCCW